jgi:hypothetical protein
LESFFIVYSFFIWFLGKTPMNHCMQITRWHSMILFLLLSHEKYLITFVCWMETTTTTKWKSSLWLYPSKLTSNLLHETLVENNHSSAYDNNNNVEILLLWLLLKKIKKKHEIQVPRTAVVVYPLSYCFFFHLIFFTRYSPSVNGAYIIILNIRCQLLLLLDLMARFSMPCLTLYFGSQKKK